MALKLFILILAFAVLGTYLISKIREARTEARYPPIGQTIKVNGKNIQAYLTGAGQDLAMILRDAAKKLGAEKPIVLGHPLGGIISMAWATHAPDDLSALALISPVVMPFDTPISTYYKMNRHPIIGPFVNHFIGAFHYEGAIQNGLDEVFNPDPPPTEYRSGLGVELVLRPKTIQSNARQRNHIHEQIRALEAQYDSVTVPIEILHGALDTTVSPSIHAEGLKNRLNDVNVTIWPDQGHMPHHFKQADILEAVQRLQSRIALKPHD